ASHSRFSTDLGSNRRSIRPVAASKYLGPTFCSSLFSLESLKSFLTRRLVNELLGRFRIMMAPGGFRPTLTTEFCHPPTARRVAPARLQIASTRWQQVPRRLPSLRRLEWLLAQFPPCWCKPGCKLASRFPLV